ncbi:MAG: response regulator [Nitrospirota bacterium]
MVEHRRLGIGGTHHNGSPPNEDFSYHNCGERRRGFVNTLLERRAVIQANIFLADDEPALLTAITKQLTQAQHRVPGFKSRDELLAAVDQEVPDLILYDIKTPEETGLETPGHLQEHY